jgi:hypothetical protein
MNQGPLTEGDGSVQLTSSFDRLFLKRKIQFHYKRYLI